MTDAVQVAEEFFGAWTGKDFNHARALLHDDLSFQGPIDTFDDADAYMQAIQGLSQIVVGATAYPRQFDFAASTPCANASSPTTCASSTTSRPRQCPAPPPPSGTGSGTAGSSPSGCSSTHARSPRCSRAASPVLRTCGGVGLIGLG